MYGLIIENFSAYLKHKYGDEAWDQVRNQANLDSPTFSIHQVYPEQLLGRLAKKAFNMVGCDADEFYEGMGGFFLQFLGPYGYSDVLALLGRSFADFCNGLDNLHEYLKFSYPRLRAPSYFCGHENEKGLQLYYRSKRRGFVHFTIGQLKSIAETLYKLQLTIEVLDEEVKFDTIHVCFKLTFDNTTNQKKLSGQLIHEARLPAIQSSMLFEIFPFVLTFGEDMILPNLAGQKINEFFDIMRPLIEFSFAMILQRSNNIFELMTVDPIEVLLKDGGFKNIDEADTDDDKNFVQDEDDKNLRMKGEMMFMSDWDLIMFLASPVLTDISSLEKAGLYINDLPMHDFSRDLIISSGQKSDSLKNAIEIEEAKTTEMQESMMLLGIEMKRSDELLSRMIPIAISEKIAAGSNAVDTCEVFDMVTIVFNDIPAFLDMCAKCDGLEIVHMLNMMFGLFDIMSEKHCIYKVETVKDSFVGVSGAPERVQNHAENILMMALDMRDVVLYVHDPRPEFDDKPYEHIKIRLGSHSGPVVAGIVGNKMPRYCLFGDAMNTSSRMMSFGEEQKIHLSKVTADLLPKEFKVSERGQIEVKGKGQMTTCWVEDRAGRAIPIKEEIMAIYAAKLATSYQNNSRADE